MTVNLDPLSKNFLTSTPYRATTTYSNPVQTVTNTSNVRRMVLPASTENISGLKKNTSNITGNIGNTGSYDQGVGVINQNAASSNDIIDQDYNNAISELAAQETSLRAGAEQASGELTNQSAQLKTQLGQEQTTKQSGVESQLATGEKNYTSNLQQARDVFNQVQQKNVADLSALGISSSSVAEALAERLGVETARRIAGATGTINEIRQNASKEIANINNYFQEKITQADQWVANEKMRLQNALMAGINQINAARDQAATDKARARASLLSDVRSQIYNLTTQQQQFQQSLEQWKVQKAAALTPYLNDQYVNSFMANLANLQQQYGSQGLSLGATIQPSATGGTGYYTAKPSNKTEEELLLEQAFK